MRPINQICSFIFISTFSIAANATVVTFEDVDVEFNNSPLYGTAQLSDGYDGISGWSNTGEVYGFAPGTGQNEGIGDRYFYGQSGDLVFDQAPVVFQGTYYKAYATAADEPAIASIELYYKGVLVHTLYDPRAPLGLVWLGSNYTGLVDKIHIRGGSEGFAIDNLSYEPSNIGQVPLPASALLFSSALVGIGLRRKSLSKNLI